MRLTARIIHPGKATGALCAGFAVTLGLLSAPAITHGAAAGQHTTVTSHQLVTQSDAVAAASGPDVQWDWTMPTNIVDEFGWNFPNQRLEGAPDGLCPTM